MKRPNNKTNWLTIFRLVWFFVFSCGSFSTFAQRGPYDTIRVAAIIIDNDTIPHAWLKQALVEVELDDDMRRLRMQRRSELQAYNILRFNVYKVYPYAVASAMVLEEVDSMMNTLHSKEAKKIYKRRKEEELNKQFKQELENLSISQGQILVKLIARQTGKPCYQIIKELKGGFNARLWQTMALLFDNNLKNNYDPTGEDAVIESIVIEIEARGRFVKTK